MAYASVVLAGGVFFYRASAPFFSGGVTPAVPMVTLVTAAALGLWCRRDYGFRSRSGDGRRRLLRRRGERELSRRPALASLAVFGLLALVGARLLLAKRWPLWLALSVVVVTALYQGYHAGQILRHDTTLPVANAAGMGVLLAAVFLVCYRAIPAGDLAGRRRRSGCPGSWPWFSPGSGSSPSIESGRAGRWPRISRWAWLRLPVLAMILLLGAWLAWPRRRRFASQPGAGAPGAHWALLGLAFFVLPLGTLRVDIPFHAPDAPSAAEAGRVMDTLLTDTYLAFNLADEDAAFDRLAENLSQDLVADVYLDSRRRLTSGHPGGGRGDGPGRQRDGGRRRHRHGRQRLHLPLSVGRHRTGQAPAAHPQPSERVCR